MKGGVYLKIISALLVSSFIVSLFSIPRGEVQAQAGCAATAISQYLGKSALGKIIGSVVPVGDNQTEIATGGQFIAKCILTPIAIQMARTMAKNISNSIVNWINNDFKGKPSFITDINGTIADSADETIGNFIYGSDLKFLCQPFAFQIRLALATKYQQPFEQQIRCSLSDVTKNVSGFAKSNGGAGWNNWLEITTQPQNNVYGAYLMADSQLASNIQSNLDKINNELTWNNGFLGFKVCDAQATDKETPAEVKARIDSAKEVADETSTAPDPAKIDPKPQCKTGGRTVTSGKLVQEQASKVLGSWADQLNLATDIDQIVGALISHFADKMVSGAQGFLGLSSNGGYAKNSIDYSQAAGLAGDASNPDNAGLNQANAAAQANISALFPASTVSTGDNIAAGKTVSESVPGVGSSAWVTDSDVTTSAATADVQDPWIEVDLGEARAIGEVHVWSPDGQSAADTVGTFDVVVSTAEGGRDWASAAVTVTDSSSNPTVVSVGKTGRYVRIERTGNSYDCGNPADGPATCYRPLEIAEIEVIAPTTAGSSATGSASTGGSEATAAAITVGPADAPSTISGGAPFTFTVPVRSTTDASVASIDVMLYQDSTPLSFSSVFSTGNVGKKQNGITNFYSPNGAPGITFTNVPVGPSTGTAILVSGTTLPSRVPRSYKIVVSAKDSSGASLGTATIDFVVQ